LDFKPQDMGRTTRIPKEPNSEQLKLKELCRAYENLVEDTTRAQNRLKAIYRGRGIDCSGTEIYRSDRRTDYLAKISDEAARFRAESLLDQIEALRELRKQAKSRFLTQARKHTDYPILSQLPGFGAVRVGQLIAIVGSPHRFRTKRQLRALLWICGCHQIERRLQRGRGKNRQVSEEGLHSRVELESQPATQTDFQRRGALRHTPRRGSGLLSATP
jgi:transposase